MSAPATTCRPGPDLRQQIIASAIVAAWDRLDIALIRRPRLADLGPNEVDVLFAALRRAIGKRQKAEQGRRVRR